MFALLQLFDPFIGIVGIERHDKGLQVKIASAGCCGVDRGKFTQHMGRLARPSSATS